MLAKCKICANYLLWPGGLSNTWGACAIILVTRVEFTSHASLQEQFLCVNLGEKKQYKWACWGTAQCSQSADKGGYLGYHGCTVKTWSLNLLCLWYLFIDSQYFGIQTREILNITTTFYCQPQRVAGHSEQYPDQTPNTPSPLERCRTWWKLWENWYFSVISLNFLPNIGHVLSYYLYKWVLKYGKSRQQDRVITSKLKIAGKKWNNWQNIYLCLMAQRILEHHQNISPPDNIIKIQRLERKNTRNFNYK